MIKTDILPELQHLLKAILVLHQDEQRQVQELQFEVDDLKAERQLLLRTIQHLQDQVAELQCLQHPYSLDGDAICNFD